MLLDLQKLKKNLCQKTKGKSLIAIKMQKEKRF